MKEWVLTIVFVCVLMAALLCAAQTEKRTAGYACPYDDQFMASDGSCINPDAWLDAVLDAQKGGVNR